jgi:hypothetical protein
MLTQEERDRIHEIERTRLDIRNEIDPPEKKAETRAAKIWKFLNSQVGMWLLGSVIFTGVTTYWSYLNERRADARHERDAMLAGLRDDSEFLVRLMPFLGSDDPDERDKAISVLLTRYPQDEIPGTIQTFLVDFTEKNRRSESASTRQVVANTVQRLERVPHPSESLVATLDQLPPRVYIQVSGDSQRDAAKSLQTELRSAGFSAPGIEKVGPAKSPPRGEVRYYNDSDQPTAEKLKAALERQGVSNVTVTRPGMKASTGTLEVWFPAARE